MMRRLLTLLISLVTLMLVASCAHVQVPVNSSLSKVPVFEAKPFLKTCTLGEEDRPCVVMLQSDYETLLLWAKAMCHALNGSDEDCQWP